MARVLDIFSGATLGQTVAHDLNATPAPAYPRHELGKLKLLGTCAAPRGSDEVRFISQLAGFERALQDLKELCTPNYFFKGLTGRIL